MLNRKAMMRSPMTIEDHQNSRWIVYPLRLFDCCLETDGAVAVVVTTLERARDMRQTPVSIMSMLAAAAAPRIRGKPMARRRRRGSMRRPASSRRT